MREQTPRVAGQAGWGLVTSLGLVLAVIAPIIFLRPTLDSFTHAPVVLAFAITLYAATRLWRLLMAGSNPPISLTFWLFVYVFFGLAALANVVSQQLPLFRQAFAESTEVDALVTIIVGLAGYEVGGLLARSRRVQERRTHRLNRALLAVWGSCQGRREFPTCGDGNSPPCGRPVRAGRRASMASRWRRMR